VSGLPAGQTRVRSPSDGGPARPTLRLMLTHPAHLLSFGLGSGLVPVSPGTAGTLLALPLHWLASAWLVPIAHLALIALLCIAGAVAAARTCRALGSGDHGAVVIDEVVSFLLVLYFVPATLAWQALAFVTFRCFDVLKPWPIRWCDRNVHGGLGVMLDDLLAGLATIATVLLLAALAGA
jgi:phosphatidylglycerophosphatase A